MTECFFGCSGRVVVKFSQSVYMGNAQKLQVTRFKETYLDAPTLIVIITQVTICLQTPAILDKPFAAFCNLGTVQYFIKPLIKKKCQQFWRNFLSQVRLPTLPLTRTLGSSKVQNNNKHSPEMASHRNKLRRLGIFRTHGKISYLGNYDLSTYHADALETQLF